MRHNYDAVCEDYDVKYLLLSSNKILYIDINDLLYGSSKSKQRPGNLTTDHSVKQVKNIWAVVLQN